jgi:serine/threonine protein kinase
VALPIGTQLGRYTVLKPLTASGLTEVVLARAAGMGGFAHHVVIKAIRASKGTDPSFISSFVDEARLAASLHHHHIVQVHDVGHEGDTYFFAMEYVHGANLRALLTKVARVQGVVPLDQVITIALGVAAGLHYAHQQDLVHRDVTPANILVGYDGNVKVTDFGIAKALFKSSEATKSGTMRGKVAYMAPEQCLGRPIDRRSDIFSLGIVLYELATARRLFKGDTDFLVMTAIVNGKIPKPTELRPDIPLDLEDVILKSLAPKPELRFATAEELAMALERVAVNNGLRISPNALSEYVKEIFGKREEPWLDDSIVVEAVDVDFDGGGTGLAPVAPPAKRARQGSVPRGEFGDEQRTEIDPTHGDDDEPATVVAGSRERATSGFEGSERTLIGEQADVDMLVGMSKIDRRHDSTPIPRRDSTPIPRRDSTPTARVGDTVPVPTIVQAPNEFEAESATIVEDNLPVTTPVPLATVVPVPPAAPEVHPASGILQRLQSSPAGWSQPEHGVTGTPMAWQSNAADAEITSLRPRGRRLVLVAAIAIPFAVIAILAYVLRDDGGTQAAKRTEPDAFVAPDAALDAPADAPKPPG